MKNYLILLLITSFTISCNYQEGDNHIHPKKECKNDSIIYTEQVCNTNLDFSNKDGQAIHNYTDGNGASWSDLRKINIRILFKPELNILIVYFNKNVYEKYNVIAKIYNYKTVYKCVNGKKEISYGQDEEYVFLKKSNKTSSHILARIYKNNKELIFFPKLNNKESYKTSLGYNF